MYQNKEAINSDSATVWSNITMKKNRSSTDFQKQFSKESTESTESTELLQKAVSFYQKGDPIEACKFCQQILKNQPSHVDALYLLSALAWQTGNYTLSLNSFNHLIKLQPDNPEIFFNYAKLLTKLNRPEEALASFNKAIELRPDFLEAYINRGIVLRALNNPDEALASFNKAIELQANYPEAHFGRSFCYLIKGDFEMGWKEFEWRWEDSYLKSKQLNFTSPLWLGQESISGKVILIHAEQGYGDTMQFCRYISLLSKKGAKVLFLVPETLVNLLSALEGVTQIIADNKTIPAFDYHCPLLSLPLAINTRMETIPAKTPYLFSTEEKRNKWSKKLGAKKMPRIGLTWSGNPSHKNDAKRNIPLELLLQTLPSGVQYLSLQKELRNTDLSTLSKYPAFLHFEEELEDFADTAALCDLMDLIISVDTSAAHLAGAMNKPVWILLPFAPDWRWLLNRNDSPWYPSMTLYRQSSRDRWDDVLTRIAADLQKEMDNASLYHTST